MVKIWHDDIRRPPDASWFWCRTNEAVMYVMEVEKVSEISMDHDLGLENEDPDDLEAVFKAGPIPLGIDLAKWMCETNKVPPKVTIHSWNPPGAAAMAAVFHEHGHDVVVKPYEVQKQ